MQCDAICFAVENDGAVTVRSYRMYFLQHLTAMGADCRYCIGQTAFGVQMHQWADRRRGIIGNGHIEAATDVMLGMRKQTELKTRAAFGCDFSTQYSRIKLNGAIEIFDGGYRPRRCDDS
jgi:hypothetical protein